MKSNMKKLVLSAFAAALLVSGALITTAEAQGRVIRRPHRPPRVIVYRPYNPFFGYRYYDPFWDPFPYSYQVVDPIAYQREQGYSEGRSEGKDDAKKGRPSNPTGHKDYVKSSSLAFREAFVQGYQNGYQEKLEDIREDLREKRGE